MEKENELSQFLFKTTILIGREELSEKMLMFLFLKMMVYLKQKDMLML